MSMSQCHSFPFIPAKAGTQFFREGSVSGICFNNSPVSPARPKRWVPASAGMSGLDVKG